MSRVRLWVFAANHAGHSGFVPGVDGHDAVGLQAEREYRPSCGGVAGLRRSDGTLVVSEGR